MLKHYIKLAFRNFRVNKVVFFGGLFTLCIGALCISLLFSYVHNELTMDDFNKREKDIFTVILQDSPSSKWSTTSPSYFFKFDYKDFLQVENAVNIVKLIDDEATISYKKETFSTEGIITDTTFFNVFDFELTVGDKKSALDSPNSIIISVEFANKIFGDENPIGKTLKVSTKTEGLFIVNGIVEIPSNSSMSFDFILPKPVNGPVGTDFILLKSGFDYNTLKKNIATIGKGHPLSEIKKIDIIPLNDMYFNKELTSGSKLFSRTGDKKRINVLTIIMLVILVISALNFSNLQIIDANTRTKQFAVNAINGAQKSNLVQQKLVEILLLLLLSVTIITVGYLYFLPYFNSFINIELSPPLWKVLAINSAILISIIILALIYPFTIIFRIRIIEGLKGKSFFEKSSISRKTILISQYVLTFVLLISSVIIAKQLNLMLDKDLGFNDENIIVTKLYHAPPYDLNQINDLKTVEDKRNIDEVVRNNYIADQLESTTHIAEFSQGYSPLKISSLPLGVNGINSEFSSQHFLRVTPNFEKVFDLKIVEGRFFNYEQDNSQSNMDRLIINEAAKLFWGIKDISENKIIQPYHENREYEIIGVVKDFNYEHLSVKPKPLVMFNNRDLKDDFFIRFNKGNFEEGLAFVKGLFNQLNAGKTFKYSLLSNEIASLYAKEKRLSVIYIFFTIVALLISTIGLFTIALYDTQRRVKEIGIRKVNGAKTQQILVMLNKDFIKWVGLAFIIAIPIAWYAMHIWLEGFAYKTTISWWIFAISGILAFLVTLMTVSWQSFKAAIANPVEALKNE